MLTVKNFLISLYICICSLNRYCLILKRASMTNNSFSYLIFITLISLYYVYLYSRDNSFHYFFSPSYFKIPYHPISLLNPSILFSLGSFPFPAHTFLRRQTEETFETRRNEGGRGDEWLNSGLGEIGNQCRKSAWKRKLTRRERVSARLPPLGYTCNAFQPVVVVD